MSFIIKGLDMPKECRAVEIKFYIPNFNLFNGREMLDREISALFTAEHLNDVIQIPKGHGRLKDEKDLLESAKPRGISKEIWEQSELYKFIVNAPTILEAEE